VRARLLAAVLLLAAPAWARRASGPPEGAELLRRSLAPAAASYEGVMRVEVYSGRLSSAKRLSVRFQKPGLYRREVLDASGQPAQVVVSDGAREWVYDRDRNRVWEGEAPDPEVKRLGPDDEFDLLTDNYDARSASTSPVAGRSAWLLELRGRADGHVQRRLWVDRKTGLVLASEDFRPGGELASSARFETLSFSRRQSKKLFKFSPPAGATVVKRLDPAFMSLGEAKSASGLEPRTPGWLPSGYVFESLDVLPRGGLKIIHYRFSDGINVLSLFQCPPKVRLDFGAKTASSVRVGSEDGTLAWTQEGQALGWEQGKSRFLLVGPLSADALVRIAASVH
jgi:outer membrane lipoprotein-sorting protein